MPDTIETRKKRAIYRANYRGFKEADIMIGGFAKAHGQDFTAQELTDFEALLEEADHNIYDWIIGARPVPDVHNTAVLARLQAYKPV